MNDFYCIQPLLTTMRLDLFTYFYGDDMNGKGEFDKSGNVTGANVKVFDEDYVLDKHEQIQLKASNIHDGNYDAVSLVNPL